MDLTFQPKKIEIIEIKPTHVKVKLLLTQRITKMGKRYFQRQVDDGWLEVVNQEKLSSVI